MKPPKPSKSPADAPQRATRVQEDLALIEMVLGGSVAHWHAFVDRYAGLIYSVIRRQLFAEEEDDVRTVFADVLESLYRGKLSEFRGSSELSTWLIVGEIREQFAHTRCHPLDPVARESFVRVLMAAFALELHVLQIIEQAPRDDTQRGCLRVRLEPA